jgi:ATP-dependent DNA ligase
MGHSPEQHLTARLVATNSATMTLRPGFVLPCLPIRAPTPPSGAEWLHEIKHDGFRVIARKEGNRVKLYSRPGNDLTDRFRSLSEHSRGCAHSLASLTVRQSHAAMTASRHSIASDTGAMTPMYSCTPST